MAQTPDNQHDSPGDAQGPKGPEVRITDLHTLHEAKFHASWDSTLQQVWDQAYQELGETKRPNDQLQCMKGGVDMTPYLSLTLRQLQEQHVCPDRHFQIHGASGGAQR